MNREKLLGLLAPHSGCDLLESMSVGMFITLCHTTSDVCEECGFKPCERMALYDRQEKEKKKANFGKHAYVTNADLANERGVSKRQIAKMRKRGEL